MVAAVYRTRFFIWPGPVSATVGWPGQGASLNENAQARHDRLYNTHGLGH